MGSRERETENEMNWHHDWERSLNKERANEYNMERVMMMMNLQKRGLDLIGPFISTLALGFLYLPFR